MSFSLLFRVIVVATLCIVAAIIAFTSVCLDKVGPAWLTTVPTAIGAITAAFIGLLVAWAAASISYAVKIAEFRQNWINELREDVADFIAAAELSFQKRREINSLTPYMKASREQKEVIPLLVAARTILNRIRLRLNPEKAPDNPDDKPADDLFLLCLQNLIDPFTAEFTLQNSNDDQAWLALSDNAVEQGRIILKREWENTKTVFKPKAS